MPEEIQPYQFDYDPDLPEASREPWPCPQCGSLHTTKHQDGCYYQGARDEQGRLIFKQPRPISAEKMGSRYVRRQDVVDFLKRIQGGVNAIQEVHITHEEVVIINYDIRGEANRRVYMVVDC